MPAPSTPIVSQASDPFKDRIESDKKLLGEFVDYLCGESYQNTGALLDYFKAHVSPDYYDSFIGNNFSPNYLQRIKNKKETVTFTRTQPGQFVKADSRTDEFKVVGIMTRKSDLNSQGELVSSEAVAFRVGLRQGPKGVVVCKVDRVWPLKEIRKKRGESRYLCQGTFTATASILI